jgi:inorganic pyrophosphatase
VLVLLDEPTFAGCRIRCRLVGVIEAEQKEKGQEAIRNDRLVAVAEKCQEDKSIHSIKELPPTFIDEIEHFFTAYHALDGKTFKPLSYRGPKKAKKLVQESMKQSQKGKGNHRGPNRNGKLKGPPASAR